MNAKIVNLRSKRKAKARTEKEKAAKENRHKFGQTKTQKKLSEAERDQLNKTLDRAKRDNFDDEQ